VTLVAQYIRCKVNGYSDGKETACFSEECGRLSMWYTTVWLWVLSRTSRMHSNRLHPWVSNIHFNIIWPRTLISGTK
jgi:hypothetical protein